MAMAPLPFATPRMPMFMAWHQRRREDPVHRWLRRETEAVAAAAVGVRPAPHHIAPEIPCVTDRLLEPDVV
jgi:hypothetical protein